MLPNKEDFKALPVISPLLAAIIAPTSTLLDIPALTETWFLKSGQRLPDPSANLVLSGVGLFFNVVANGLLILRFSSDGRRWRLATELSLACWIVKFGIGFGNVLAFGILTRNEPGIGYGEGFWCAVLSVLMSCLIVAMLLLHFIMRFRHQKGAPTETQLSIRLAGRQFMMQNVLFVCTIAVLALFMSQLEGWSYLQGIYFAVVSFLTIGFGDFAPTRTVTRIVLFPFLLVGIVQLASLIDMIVTYFKGRAASSHAARRAAFMKRKQDQEDDLEKEPDLGKELRFLQHLYKETNKWDTVQDLSMNLLGFVTFWVIGAAIFSQIEGWAYGTGLYFSYVIFFAVGYGDFAPITNAGRVVFIMYALIAVPVMSSFAVGTVQEVLKKIATNRLHKRRAEAGLDADTGLQVDLSDKEKGEKDDKKHKAFRSVSRHFDSKPRVPHTESESTHVGDDNRQGLPKEARDRLADNQEQDKLKEGGKGAYGTWQTPHWEYVAQGHKRVEERLHKLESSAEGLEAKDKDEDRILTEYILELAVEVERRARRLLLGHMREDSTAHMLLKADRLVQLRNIKILANDERKGKRPNDVLAASKSAGGGGEKEGEASDDGDPEKAAVRRDMERERAEQQEEEGSDSEEESKDDKRNDRKKQGEQDEQEEGGQGDGEGDGDGEGEESDMRKEEKKEGSYVNEMMRKYYDEEVEITEPLDLDERETLEEVTRYRESFANLLAVGSRLMKLKDEEQFLFERRLRNVKGEMAI